MRGTRKFCRTLQGCAKYLRVSIAANPSFWMSIVGSELGRAIFLRQLKFENVQCARRVEPSVIFLWASIGKATAQLVLHIAMVNSGGHHDGARALGKSLQIRTLDTTLFAR